jgi:hypothetical protein
MAPFDGYLHGMTLVRFVALFLLSRIGLGAYMFVGLATNNLQYRTALWKRLKRQ